MTKKPSVEALEAVLERDIGGLDALERQLVYARVGLTPAQIANVEIMVRDSGLRNVGQGALNNVRVQFFSKKNRHCRTLESHTCERLFAYELEIDPEVLGYFVQIPCRRILRLKDGGKQHISQATLDFLIFYKHDIKLVECKYRSWLEKAEKTSDEWVLTEKGWTCLPYESWTKASGLSFEICYPPWPLGLYLRNQEAIYALRDVTLTASEQRTAARALAQITAIPRSLDQLRDSVPGFRERIALWLMAHGKAFGALKSTSIDIGDRFHLYITRTQAESVDRDLLVQLARSLDQPETQDPLLKASKEDYQQALRRLARMSAIAEGKEEPTRRMRELARRVARAVSNGRSPLSACLTNYADSGNRTPRLLVAQQEALDLVIQTRWNSGKTSSQVDLWFDVEDECLRHQIPTPSKTTMRREVKKEDVTKRALANGGMRAYQSVKPSSDPRDRSLRSLGYGHTLHIDSSQFDNRLAPNLELLFPAAKPTFYIGIDDATSKPMAHSLIFGSARTDGFAILIREFVFQHSFLPSIIFVDRGPENTSYWIKQFCRENGITLMHSPTGASRFNGLAENCIKHVNTQVAHKLVGSTEPDMRGRCVDGKFKSRANARTTFVTVNDMFKDYVYGDLSRTPLGDGGTPDEKRDEALSKYGLMGVSHPYNDELLIKTSVLINHKGKTTEKRGIRTQDGFYTSEELKPLLRTAQPEEVRQDCVDPSVLYVKFCSAWVKAFHSRVLTTALLTTTEKLYELLSGPLTKKLKRADQLVVDRDRFHRNKAQASLPANSHLAPEAKAPASQAEVTEEQLPIPEWDSLDLLPEE